MMIRVSLGPQAESRLRTAPGKLSMPMSETKTSFISEDLLPRRRDLPTRAAGQDLLVREPETGGVHFLNAAAAVVWDCCDGVTPISDCASRLRERFAVPADTDLAADIHAIAADLAERGLFLGSRKEDAVAV